MYVRLLTVLFLLKNFDDNCSFNFIHVLYFKKMTSNKIHTLKRIILICRNVSSNFASSKSKSTYQIGCHSSCILVNFEPVHITSNEWYVAVLEDCRQIKKNHHRGQ